MTICDGAFTPLNSLLYLGSHHALTLASISSSLSLPPFTNPTSLGLSAEPFIESLVLSQNAPIFSSKRAILSLLATFLLYSMAVSVADQGSP